MPSVSAKRGKLAFGLALGLFATVGVQPAFAQTQYYIDAEDRAAESDRPIAVIVPQEELATSIQLGRIIPNEGGLLGALIDRRPEKMAQNAAAKAYDFAKPLQDAMAGFDARTLAMAATEQLLSELGWFAKPQPQLLTGSSMAMTTANEVAARGDTTVSMTFEIGYIGNEANDTVGALNWNKERNRLEKEFAAAHSGAGEIAVISWRYQVSPNFTNMQVIADIAIRPSGSDTRRFEQQFISLVKLKRPTFVEEENVAIWAANDGALAKQALEMAFARAGEVLPTVLSLDKNGYRDATDKKKNPRATGGNFSGPQLMRDDKGPVLYAKDGDQRLRAFVAVQTIDNQ